jgi:hypothetical protein
MKPFILGGGHEVDFKHHPKANLKLNGVKNTEATLEFEAEKLERILANI